MVMWIGELKSWHSKLLDIGNGETKEEEDEEEEALRVTDYRTPYLCLYNTSD